MGVEFDENGRLHREVGVGCKGSANADHGVAPTCGREDAL